MRENCVQILFCALNVCPEAQKSRHHEKSQRIEGAGMKTKTRKNQESNFYS